MTIRVLIADDQELVRTGFRVIVSSEPDMQVVGEAADGEQAIEAATRRRPDVVLMDIRMPHLDGIQATRRLTAGHNPTRIIVLTTFDLDEYVYESLRAGASGFLLKDARSEELLHAIRVVAEGEAMLAPSVTRTLIADYARRPPHRDHPPELASLTPRELEVLGWLARGFTNAEVARKLGVGEATVKTHIARLFAKLHLRDRVQAVILAYECGLLQADGHPAGSSTDWSD